MKQHDLYQLLPGVAGGRALRIQRGPDYHAHLGSRGGAATVARYGRAYMAHLGERGRAARRVKRATAVRTATHIDGTRYRVIPWQPHLHSPHYSPHRKHPLLIWIALDDQMC